MRMPNAPRLLGLMALAGFIIFGIATSVLMLEPSQLLGDRLAEMTCLQVAFSLTETAAAAPVPCPVTVQHIIWRIAACDILSPATQRPATSKLFTFCGTVIP